MSASDAIVTLDVGGQIYRSTRSTLTRYPDSMLGAMFGGDFDALRDDQGRYFIDRDGTLFRHVLNFLRTSQLILPEDFKELSLLEIEADFYQIQPLIEAIRIRKASCTHDVVFVTYNKLDPLEPTTVVASSREVEDMVKDMCKTLCVDQGKAYVAALLGRVQDIGFTVQSYGVVPSATNKYHNDYHHTDTCQWVLVRKSVKNYIDS